MAPRAARKLVRSMLVRFPGLYDRLTSQWRYRAYHRLGIVHDHDFKALPLLVDTTRPLVLDVGGNNGQSILSIKTVLPEARVVTFEPASRHQKDLQALADQLADVTVEGYALAEEDGEAELFWPVYNGLAMHGLASLDRSEAEAWLGPESMYGFDPERQVIESERVRMRRLDDLGLEPDVIKIDVQGTEAAVVAGGIETIRKSLPAIMAEDLAEDDRAVALLEPLGYRLYSFHKNRFERGVGSGATNQFLIPEERRKMGRPDDQD
jgi:FkbM family methyltransferase